MMCRMTADGGSAAAKISHAIGWRSIRCGRPAGRARDMEGASAARTMVPEPAELIARARAMIPALAARSAEQMKRRSILPETMAEMQAAGLFQVPQPRRWCGFEMELSTFYEILIALGQADMA